MANKHMRRCAMLLDIWDKDTTSHLLRWLKRLVVSSISKGQEPRELSYTAGRIIKLCFGKQFSGLFFFFLAGLLRWSVFCHLSTHLSCDPAIPPLHVIHPRKIKACSQKDVCRNVHNSAVHNSSKLETTQVSISRQINRNCSVLTKNTTSQQKGGTTRLSNMNESPRLVELEKCKK